MSASTCSFVRVALMGDGRVVGLDPQSVGSFLGLFSLPCRAKTGNAEPVTAMPCQAAEVSGLADAR
jgi:hypothetical protein